MSSPFAPKSRNSSPTAKWFPGTTRPIPASMFLEYYDYATPEGRAETRSHPDDPRAKAMAQRLFNHYVPQQMEAPLPPPLKKNGGKGSRKLHQIRGAVQCAEPGQAHPGRQARDVARVR